MNEYSIKQVAAKMNLSEVYVRRMILKGKLATRQVEIQKNTFKHLISEDELNRWRESVGQRSKREDGRMKFTLYANEEEAQRIRELLENDLIKRANKVKEVTNVTTSD